MNKSNQSVFSLGIGGQSVLGMVPMQLDANGIPRASYSDVIKGADFAYGVLGDGTAVTIPLAGCPIGAIAVG